MSIFESPGHGRILEGFGPTTISTCREKFAVAKPHDQWLALYEAALLERLRCWRKNRDTRNYGLTFAGRLMFSKHGAIVTLAAPRYLVDYRDYRGQHRAAQKWSVRLFSDRTWEANLFLFIRHSWIKLTSNLKAVLRASKAAQTINAA